MKTLTYLVIDTPDRERLVYLPLDFPNANTKFPLTLKICRECNLQHEHVIQEVLLQPWGDV